MYKSDFEGLLRSGKIPKYFMFYGACSYQIELLVSQLTTILNASNDEKMAVYFEEYNFASTKNFLSQSSLFGDRNILILKTDQTIPAKELKVLIDASIKNEDSYFIFHYCGEDKKANDIAKSFDKNFVRVFKAEYNEAINILERYARAISLNISRNILAYLYTTHSEDLSLSINECNKLRILDKEISHEDIDEFVYGLGAVTIDKLILRLLRKEDFKDEFARLVDGDGVNETIILLAIESFISQLFLFHSHIKLHGSIDKSTTPTILGHALPPKIQAERIDLCIKIDLKTYKRLLNHLITAHYDMMKIKNIDSKSYLLSSLIKFQTLL